MIKTVIFDLGGVYFTDGTKEAIKIINKQYGVPEEKVRSVLHGELGSKYRLNEISIDELWTEAKKQWGINASSADLTKIWLSGYKPIQGTIDIINELKSKYELLYLSDNTQDRVDYLEGKFHFLSKFNDGVFSHLVGVRKPNPLIYKEVLKKTKSSPEECVYIDDKPDMLIPAKKLGMNVIAFKNSEQLRKDLINLKINLKIR